MRVLFFLAAIAFLLVLASQAFAQGTTVTVVVHRIAASDPIDGPNDQADWYYYVGPLADPTSGTYVWQSSLIPIADNRDDLTVDRIHQFTGDGGATFFNFVITVCDKDYYFWEGSDDLADISAAPGGGRDNVGSPCPQQYVRGASFQATYDATTHKLVSGDRVEFDGTYYRTSGDWDGSTSVDENDATLYFQISDNYEPTPSPTPAPAPSPTPTVAPGFTFTTDKTTSGINDIVTLQGKTNASTGVDITLTKGSPADVVFVLADAGASYTGSCSAKGPAPVQGSSWSNLCLVTKTDGSFLLQIRLKSVATYEFTAQTPGYGPKNVALSVAAPFATVRTVQTLYAVGDKVEITGTCNYGSKILISINDVVRVNDAGCSPTYSWTWNTSGMPAGSATIKIWMCPWTIDAKIGICWPSVGSSTTGGICNRADNTIELCQAVGGQVKGPDATWSVTLIAPGASPAPTPTPSPSATQSPSPPSASPCSLYILTCPTGQQFGFFIRSGDASQLYSDSSCLVPTTFQCPAPAPSPTSGVVPSPPAASSPPQTPHGPPFTPPGPPSKIPPVAVPPRPSPPLLPQPAGPPSSVPGSSPPPDEVADLRSGARKPGWQRQGPVLVDLKRPKGEAEQVAVVYYRQETERSDLREVLGSLADVLPIPTVFVMTSRHPGFSDAEATNLSAELLMAELARYDISPASARHVEQVGLAFFKQGTAKLPKGAFVAGEPTGLRFDVPLGKLTLRAIAGGWNISGVAVGVGGFWLSGEIAVGNKTFTRGVMPSGIAELIQGVAEPSNPPTPGFEAALSVVALAVAYLAWRRPR